MNLTPADHDFPFEGAPVEGSGSLYFLGGGRRVFNYVTGGFEAIPAPVAVEVGWNYGMFCFMKGWCDWEGSPPRRQWRNLSPFLNKHLCLCSIHISDSPSL